ncbi:MAG TPA: DUF4112 domain-containing protein, partial [Longimicrobium sp.]|nr:DUF4112 domain-containing protein [Longimicrobium sp.]
LGGGGGIERLAYLLDDSIPIPGTGRRIGLDAVIGLVPGVGDLAGTALSGVIVVQAARRGAPLPVLLRMVLNVGIEALVGAIPFVGDLFDAGWKANRRNIRLLDAARLRPEDARRSSTAFVAGVVVLLLLLLGGIAALAWVVLRALWNLVA